MARALDELAAASPSAFVQTRNALAARLRKAGHAREAAEIAARRRPSVVLWLVNRLARTDAAGIRRLLHASDRLRRAQLRDPAPIREATSAYRAALQHLMERTEHLLGEAGIRHSPNVFRRVQATLSAAAADRRTHPALRQGQLLEEVEPGGFEILAGTPVRHLTLVKPPKDRKTRAPAQTTRAQAKDRKAEERAQRQAARREARAQQRQATKLKADAARRQRAIDRATRQAERLREQLRMVEARIEKERRQDITRA